MIEVIQEYKSIMNHIDDFIKQSGYKIGFLEKQLNVNKVTFWRKRKNGTFTLSEMEILSAYIFTQEIEDNLLGKIVEKTKQPEFMGTAESEDFINAL